MFKHRLIGPSAWIIGAAGLVLGVGAAWLVSMGNPGNMGLCIACFNRDIAGFFLGANANMGGVAYIRPEIIGLIGGALGAALLTREFRPRGGSATILRFVLGFIFMVSSLIFLGCTVRAWLRLGGGDLNALYGIAGIIAGVSVGSLMLKGGYNLGRAKKLGAGFGWTGPAIAAVLFVLAALWASGTALGAFTVTPEKAKIFPGVAVVQGENVLRPEGASIVEGAVVAADGEVLVEAEKLTAARPAPGGLRAPFLISIVAGLAFGIVAQRSRFCTVGGIRDVLLVRRFDLMVGVAGLLIGATVANLAFGQFNLGFLGQPVAHTNALGNFAAMVVAGLTAIMMGGCPFRQVIMSGEGDADATMAVVGMIAGAGFAHWQGLASSPAGLAPNAWLALGVMAVVLAAILFIKRERVV
ncbi:MAG: YeeE/YedE family protein [Clostridiales bacterium]|nr:YeeE/YedE family protein [Clostridiales bacterium]